MELTKEQIQYIENRLIKDGVKYWDIRIEMLDHIVSDIERNANTKNFDSELQRALKNANWDKSLVDINQEALKNINRKYRTQFHKEILLLLKNAKYIFFLITFCFNHYLLSKNLNFKTFDRINIILFLFPIIFYLVFAIKAWTKKYGKSANLLYGMFYFSFSFLILQMIPQFMRDTSYENKILMWLILIPIYYTMSFSGYRLCKKTITKIEIMKKELAI
ncbi:hypothetical protein C8N26_0432 [Tenacibaculum lutimaris]|uniref:Uncharacterized protein n=1 Tax=Tenacibaculum lutimaris TaxID=285258 RepID=A0A420E557_9FLAO|nr:hypothetical protein [Tenacibaculum lutimaris]RKF05033.1 hypothetical protein C8N26_0432 [Tenacibaculum lutimaris]